jgi:hypothetical protein
MTYPYTRKTIDDRLAMLNCNYEINVSGFGTLLPQGRYDYDPVVIGSFSGKFSKFNNITRTSSSDPRAIFNILEVTENSTYNTIRYTSNAYLEIRLLPRTLKSMHIEIDSNSKNILSNNPIYYAKLNSLEEIKIDFPESISGIKIKKNSLNI